MSRADEFFSDAPSPDDAPPRKKATQMSTDLIKRLRDALQQAVNCLSLEVILQGRDPDLAEWNAAIAEADAHLKNGGEPLVVYLPCIAHKGMGWTQIFTATAKTVSTICPICYPPEQIK